MYVYLSLVSASYQDEDCPGCDGGTQLPLVLSESLLPAHQLARTVLSWVITGLQNKIIEFNPRQSFCQFYVKNTS